MGWKVRWYKANKEKPVILTKDDEGYDCITINGEEIMYEQGTDVWCDLSYNNDELKKDLK